MFFFFTENKEIAIKVYVYKICRNGDYDICMNLEVPAKCVRMCRTRMGAGLGGSRYCRLRDTVSFAQT